MSAHAAVDDRAAILARDALLVERVLRGERDAFREIYALYEPAISRRVRRVLVRLEDVEEVVQRVFVEVFRSLSRFDPARPLGAWLHGIAMRWTQNLLRERRRRFWQIPTDASKLDVADVRGARSPEDDAASRELVTRLHAAMESLPAPKRAAFALVVLDGAELAEAGEVLGAPAKTIWARVQSARTLIKKHLQRTVRRDTTSPPREDQDP